MAGMRDRLIHDYETIDVEVILKTVVEDIPQALPRVQSLRQLIRRIS
jgi:uncharacterized protein with HEPN domain